MYMNFGGSRTNQVLSELILQFSALRTEEKKKEKKRETAF
jgi:hypothetical protein